MDSRIGSIFAPYFTNLQPLVDNALELFADIWYEDYFDTAIPTFGLQYSTAVGASRIEAAASIISLDSASPKRSLPNLTLYAGNLAPLSATYRLSQEQIRNWHQLQSMGMVSDPTKMTAVLKLIYDGLTRASNAPHKRIDFMVLQALSTGKIDINVTNNPDGVVDASAIDLLQRPDNIFQASVAPWSDRVNSTPMSDIEFGIVIPAWNNRGLKFNEIFMDMTTFYHMQQSVQVQNLVRGYLLSTGVGGIAATLQQVNEYMAANLLPTIKIIRESIGIESDGKITPTNPWAAGQVTFVPAGKLGTIHNAFDIEQINPVTGVNYAQYKGALISKWSQTDPYNEFTRGSYIAFPGFEMIDHIFRLDSTTYSGQPW